MAAFNLVKMSFCMDICVSKKLWQCKNAHSSNLHLSYTVKYLQITKEDFQRLMCIIKHQQRGSVDGGLCAESHLGWPLIQAVWMTAVWDAYNGLLKKMRVWNKVISTEMKRCGERYRSESPRENTLCTGWILSVPSSSYLAWGCGKSKQRTCNCSHTRTDKPTLKR